MKRFSKIVALSLLTCFALSSSFAAKKQKTIKLGFNIPLTGDSSKVGEGAKFAGEIIKNEINSAGGLSVKGEKYLLEFVYVDNELKADSAINAANKLIDIDKVLASIGPEGSGRAIPAGFVSIFVMSWEHCGFRKYSIFPNTVLWHICGYINFSAGR